MTELKDWEAVAADQAMTIVMMKQREWAELTDEEVNEIARWADEHGGTFHISYAKGIESKLKEKNT